MIKCNKGKSLLFLIGFFYFTFNLIHAQDQRVADSLAVIYKEDKLSGALKLELLKNLAFNELNDSNLALHYADELIALSKLENDNSYLYSGYLQKGNRYLYFGEIEKALDNYYICLDIAKKSKNLPNQGTANMSIADAYNVMGNYSNAESYYIKAIDLLRKTNDSNALASALLNAGDSYFNNKKYDKALQNFEESGLIFEHINYQTGIAYNLGNAGMVYAQQGKDAVAEEHMNKAIKILEDQRDYLPVAVYLTFISDIYVKKGNILKALEYAERSLELAKQYKLKDQISDANLKLYELYILLGNSEAALDFYKTHIIYRDSVKNIESVQKIADLRTDYEVSQKQTEINQQKKTKRIIVYATSITIFLISLLVVGLFKRNKFVRATNKIIEAEKQRSDNLLLNILPEETAQELKDNGRVEAKRFESVTVLFTDFKGFTTYAEHLSPEKLVSTVDFYFSKFDEIIEKYDLEKIKTVGDAYMCAGGLPFPTEDHAVKMVMAARDIIEFVNTTKNNQDEIFAQLDIRVGINTGAVVAGVVGSKKFAYDIWGDTVNIASRMESSSEPGKINISENTYELVKDKFNCKFRGEIEVKNRGLLKMYFVDCLKENE